MDNTSIFREVMYIIITVLLPVVVKYLAAYINQKQKNLVSQIENEKTKPYIDSAITAITAAVVSVNQTYVDSLKKNGEFTPESQKEAYTIAKEKALAMISEDAKQAIATVYGDVDSFIDAFIESKVKENK